MTPEEEKALSETKAQTEVKTDADVKRANEEKKYEFTERDLQRRIDTETRIGIKKALEEAGFSSADELKKMKTDIEMERKAKMSEKEKIALENEELKAKLAKQEEAQAAIDFREDVRTAALKAGVNLNRPDALEYMTFKVAKTLESRNYSDAELNQLDLSSVIADFKKETPEFFSKETNNNASTPTAPAPKETHQMTTPKNAWDMSPEEWEKEKQEKGYGQGYQ